MVVVVMFSFLRIIQVIGVINNRFVLFCTGQWRNWLGKLSPERPKLSWPAH